MGDDTSEISQIFVPFSNFGGSSGKTKVGDIFLTFKIIRPNQFQIIENIFLLYGDLSPVTAGSARINAKERQMRRQKIRKGTEALRVKTLNPILGN